jgi:uncharacterized protein (DUF2147 family)
MIYTFGRTSGYNAAFDARDDVEKIGRLDDYQRNWKRKHGSKQEVAAEQDSQLSTTYNTNETETRKVECRRSN